MFNALTRVMGTLVAAHTHAVATLIRMAGRAADWLIRQLIWLTREIEAAIRRLIVRLVKWTDVLLMRVIRTVWLVEGFFAHGTARLLSFSYQLSKLGVFYLPSFACWVWYMLYGSLIAFWGGWLWLGFMSGFCISLLFTKHENAADVRSPDISLLATVMRVVFRVIPLGSCVCYYILVDASAYTIVVGCTWAVIGLFLTALSANSQTDFKTLSEFVLAPFGFRTREQHKSERTCVGDRCETRRARKPPN
jgi:hypothetical protein